MIVLDASALLAFLFRESGHQRVADIVGQACISTVNVAEVVGRFTRDGHDANDVHAHLAASPIELVPFLAEDAAIAAALEPATRPLSLSLGDRACLALARVRNAPAWTADRQWARLDIGIDIELIR